MHVGHAGVVFVGVGEVLLVVVLVGGGEVDVTPGGWVLLEGLDAVGGHVHVGGVGHVDFGGLEAGFVELAAEGENHLAEDFGGLLDFVLNAYDGGCGAGALFGELAVADYDAGVLVGLRGLGDRLFSRRR